jgi:hypothetical protein
MWLDHVVGQSASDVVQGGQTHEITEGVTAFLNVTWRRARVQIMILLHATVQHSFSPRMQKTVSRAVFLSGSIATGHLQRNPMRRKGPCRSRKGRNGLSVNNHRVHERLMHRPHHRIDLEPLQQRDSAIGGAVRSIAERGDRQQRQVCGRVGMG